MTANNNEQEPMGFTKEEIEYFRKLSEYKYAVDLQSKLVDAMREGVYEVATNVARKGLKGRLALITYSDNNKTRGIRY